MQPLILCVHMDQAYLMRLSFTALSLGIHVKEVREDQWGQSLAALCGLTPMTSNPPRVKVTEMMSIFAHFPNGLLDQFLSEMRKNHLAPIRLKAVLTPHNQSWNCGQLCAMLSQEVAEIEKAQKRKSI